MDLSLFKIGFDIKYINFNYKIELSKDNLVIEEMKQVLASKKSNFYTIPMRNVVSCFDLKETKTAGRVYFKIRFFKRLLIFIYNYLKKN